MSAFSAEAGFLDKLREPFPREQIGKLPKPHKKDAEKGRCSECGGWHGLPAMHLDFVGHAAVTDRLNHVAPGWTYTVDRVETVNGHVLGILGTMTIEGKSIQEAGGVGKTSEWGEELKLAISDFIRRGAMRFGVALDLWSKEDLQASEEAPARGPSSGASGDVRAKSSRPAGPSPDSSVPSSSVEEVVGTGSSGGGEGGSVDGEAAGQPEPPSDSLDRLFELYLNKAHALRAANKRFGVKSLDELGPAAVMTLIRDKEEAPKS